MQHGAERGEESLCGTSSSAANQAAPCGAQANQQSAAEVTAWQLQDRAAGREGLLGNLDPSFTSSPNALNNWDRLKNRLKDLCVSKDKGMLISYIQAWMSRQCSVYQHAVVCDLSFYSGFFARECWHSSCPCLFMCLLFLWLDLLSALRGSIVWWQARWGGRWSHFTPPLSVSADVLHFFLCPSCHLPFVTEEEGWGCGGVYVCVLIDKVIGKEVVFSLFHMKHDVGLLLCEWDKFVCEDDELCCGVREKETRTGHQRAQVTQTDMLCVNEYECISSVYMSCTR